MSEVGECVYLTYLGSWVGREEVTRDVVTSNLLHADEDCKRLKQWTAVEGGPVAMSAEAEWS